ncbi:putative NRAMP family protein [Medicago truncatula]|uniref:Metal transporter Nramp4 protein, putative n=1 Tax=Medicago truncatula TaxID=3880 RepID=G7JJG7_MEDTR|nr:metal transporter Nramp4 protein, putative [Medicago truncatula]RHN59382.1 putative NRAMP family protein [Medicago truncatula]
MSHHQQQQPLLEQQQEEIAYDSSEKVVVGTDEEKAYEADVDSGVRIPAFSWKKLPLFSGPGFLMSIAFLDLGNLEEDL